MTYGDVGFRGVYRRFFLIGMTDGLRKIGGQADGLLCWGGVDPAAGLVFAVLAAAKKTADGYAFFPPEEEDARILASDADDAELSLFADSDGALRRRFAPQLETLSDLTAPPPVEKTRALRSLDSCRHPFWPDDVQVELVKEGLRPEVCWVRVGGQIGDQLTGLLLNEPNQPFGLHAGEALAFTAEQGADKRTRCKASLDPARRYTKEELADGRLLRKAVAALREKNTRERFAKVMEILHDSEVWLPCNPLVNENEKKGRILLREKAPAAAPEDVHLVPDLLKNGDLAYLPVFSSAEEMGEYGDRFLRIRRPFLDVVHLAEGGEPAVAGIVLDPFTEPFLIRKELFAPLEEA